MALITAAAREELIALYVSMFNAAPGANNLSDMVRAVENGSSTLSVASTLAASANFSSVYPGFLTGQEFAARLVSNMLGSEVIQAAKDWATNWVLTNLNAGKSRAQIILEAVQAVRATTNTNYTNAKAALANKVDVATYYSITKELSSTNLSNLQAVLSGVTSAAASVTAAKTAVDGTAVNQAGQNFTLSASIDTIDGTGGNDTILGDATTASAADTINGGGGNDTLKLFGTLVVGNLTSVENIELSNTIGNLNTAAQSGVTNVTLKATDLTVAQTYTLASTQTLTLVDVDDSTNSGAVLTIAGGGATQTVNMTGVGNTLANDQNLDISSVFTTTLNINNTTTASSITLGNSGAKITSMSVSGDQAVTLQAASGTSATVTTYNITNTGGATLTSTAGTGTVNGFTVTGAGGAESVTLSQAAGANALSDKVKVDLGAGNDTLMITALTAGTDINGTATFKGGDGTDVLNIRNGAVVTAGTGTLFTGFETFSVGGGTGTYDLDLLVAGNTIGSLTTTAGAGAAAASLAAAVTVNNLPSAASVTFNGSVTGSLTVNQKDAGAGSPDDVLNVGITGSILGGGRTIAAADVNDIETVNLTATGTATAGVAPTHTYTLFTADEATKVTVNATTANLTFTAISANALVLFDATASTANVIVNAADAYVATSGVAFRGGAGNDTITLTGATTAGTGLEFVLTGNGGEDTLTLSAAGQIEHIVYLAAADSTASKFDIVTNFTTAEDKIDLKAFAFGTAGAADDAVLTVGTGVSVNASGDIEVSAGSNFFNDAGVDRAVVEAVVGADTFVFVDANKDGDFTAAGDVVIKLVGVLPAAFAVTDIVYA
jgi:hypothetical protein